MLEYYIENKIYIGMAAELFAAIAAILYLRKVNNIEKAPNIFAFYIIAVFLADLIGGTYPLYAYFNDYQVLSFIKDTPFAMNHWWYNAIHLVSFLVLAYVIGTGLNTKRFISILKISSVGFFIFSMLRFFWLGDYFLNRDIGVEIAGTALVLLSSGFYFMELLYSDRILNFAYKLRFYIALGASVFYLIFVPIEIYSSYFTSQNPEFIDFHSAVLRYIAILMYGVFSFGFYMDYRGKKIIQ